jgi:hypothetical protein
MMATVPKSESIIAFPQQELEDAIVKWWNEETSKRLNDPFAVPGTLYDVLTEVDSLCAVNVLLAIEPIIGFSPPESVIKAGGYANRQEMIDHLSPKLRNLYTKRSHLN